MWEQERRRRKRIKIAAGAAGVVLLLAAVYFGMAIEDIFIFEEEWLFIFPAIFSFAPESTDGKQGA